MKLNHIIRSYCQGKSHRIFLLLATIGNLETIITIGIFKYFFPEIVSFFIYVIMLLIVFSISSFVAFFGKHLFR